MKQFWMYGYCVVFAYGFALSCFVLFVAWLVKQKNAVRKWLQSVYE